MDNNENVKHFVESFVKFDENVKAAQEYIKETYNIDSTYSDEDDTIYIWTENLNENLETFVKNYNYRIRQRKPIAVIVD